MVDRSHVTANQYFSNGDLIISLSLALCILHAFTRGWKSIIETRIPLVASVFGRLHSTSFRVVRGYEYHMLHTRIGVQAFIMSYPYY